MAKLPLLSAKEIAKALAKAGFILVRQEGSHMFFSHPDGRATVVPCHAGETIGRGLLLKIIKKDLHMAREEFENLL
ncbi:type II toxin-antitoxin system HicA family toxin [Candidatus Micrarchaeota archaeon]|nr:type II toxin-antitoxin system HicA family toxin [Candidatus Micrarchaeota archaeon]